MVDYNMNGSMKNKNEITNVYRKKRSSSRSKKLNSRLCYLWEPPEKDKKLWIIESRHRKQHTENKARVET